MNPSPTTQERPIEDHRSATNRRPAGTTSVSRATRPIYIDPWPLLHPMPTLTRTVAPTALLAVDASPTGDVDPVRELRLAEARVAAARGIAADTIPADERATDWERAS